MPAPKGNQYARGNKGGRPTKYKPEFAEIAEKLCAKCAYTDAQLADWFEVSVRTINEWKLKHPDFVEALKVGKAETDDLVERGTVAGIIGYYVTVDEMDRFGNVRQMRKWIAGNPQAGMKWLQARRPKIYREQKDVHHTLNMDDAFLRFLDQIDEEQKMLRSSSPRMIEHQHVEPVQPSTHRSELQPLIRDDEFSHSTRARVEAVDAEPTKIESSACTAETPALVDEKDQSDSADGGLIGKGQVIERSDP
jgi:hypothetical protein